MLSFSADIMLVFFVLMLVFAFFVYLDANQLRQEFPVSPKLFLYSADNELSVDKGIITGIQGVFNGTAPRFLNEDEINLYRSFYKSNDYESMLKGNFKIFIVQRKAFDGLTGDITFFGKEVSKDFLLDTIQSDESFDITIGHIAEGRSESVKQLASEKLKEEIGGEAEVDSLIFSLVLQKALEQEGQSFIVNQYKKGNLEIYPETITLKLMKMLPDFVIRGIVK